VTAASTNCAANTSRVWQVTGGFWWDVYKGDFGRLRVGGQGSYTERQIFAGMEAGPTPTKVSLWPRCDITRSRLKIGSLLALQNPFATTSVAVDWAPLAGGLRGRLSMASCLRVRNPRTARKTTVRIRTDSAPPIGNCADRRHTD